MKKILVISIGIVISLFITCEKNGTTPTCTDGIQNGNETGIDCGGDCDPCFECTTNNCILLSGGTSSDDVGIKEWILVGPESVADVEWMDQYYSNGKFTKSVNGEVGTGYWKFDNPSSPKKIIVTIEQAPPTWKIDVPWQYPLLTLKADTLRYNDHFSKFNLVLIPR
jgi:hypothetical protein